MKEPVSQTLQIFSYMWNKAPAKCPFETPHFRAPSMNPEHPAFSEGQGPWYLLWRRHSKVGNYSFMILNIHVDRWNHRIAIQAKVCSWEGSWDISGGFSHTLINQALSLWVLAVSVLTRAIAYLFVVYTLVRKGISVFLLLLREPCGEGFMWMILKFSSWSRGNSGPANQWSRERWVVSQRGPGLGWLKCVLLCIFHQDVLKGAKSGVW